MSFDDAAVGDARNVGVTAVAAATLGLRPACADDEIAGYAALTPYRTTPAFQRTVEDSVYVDRRWRGRGVGRLLVTHVLDQATALGHHSVFARITAENAASRRLHEQLGFR